MRLASRLVASIATLAFAVSACHSAHAAGYVGLVQADGQTPVSSSSPLPTTSVSSGGVAQAFDTAGRAIERGVNSTGLTDFSGAITTGGTSQTCYAGASGLIYILIQNPKTATETLFVNFGAAASTTDGKSIGLEAGERLVFENGFIPGNSINVTGATTGHKFVCKAA